MNSVNPKQAQSTSSNITQTAKQQEEMFWQVKDNDVCFLLRCEENIKQMKDTDPVDLRGDGGSNEWIKGKETNGEDDIPHSVISNGSSVFWSSARFSA